MKSPQRCHRHRLGSVGYRFQATGVVPVIRLCQQKEVYEGRRGWQNFDLVTTNGRENSIRASIGDSYCATTIRQDMQHGIDAADMVVQKERDCAKGASTHLELR
jgi:hypothetical protein